MRIVVLAGGLSMERDVSLSSGTKVCRALRSRGHQAILVDMFYGLENYTGALEEVFDVPDGFCSDRSVATTEPDLAAVRRNRKLKSPSVFGKDVLSVCAMADVVFLALHGMCGEDGRVQATFDLLGIPYTGAGYLSSAIAMDKDMTKRLVASAVSTPKWETVAYTEEEIESVVARTAIPCVVKPVANGSSIGVSIVHSKEELRKALFDCLPLGAQVILEEYVSGREFTVAVFKGEALPVIEIIPKTDFYNYANKYQAGATEEICPAQISDEWAKRMSEDAVKVYETLGLQIYSRADFIVTSDGTPYFLEINTLPGMTPTSLVPQAAAAVGMSYEDLCEAIVQESMKCERGV